MTLFPDSVIEAAPLDANPILRVSTKYMETFVPVRPVSSGTELHTFPNRAGVLDVYSVGTDGQVNRLRRGQDAAAPYDPTALGVRAQQLCVFTGATGDADRPAIFGLDGHGQLTLSIYQPSGSYLQRECHPEGATEPIDRFLAVRGVTGRIYVNVVLRDGRLATNYYDPLKQSWGSGGWAPVLGPDGKEAKVESIAMAGNDPRQSALFAIGKDGEVLFAEDSFRTSRLRSLRKKATHLAIVTDGAKLLCLFAAEQNTGLLWLKRQRKHSTQGIQFDDWVRVDPSQSGQLSELRANLRVDNLVEVFAYDDSGDLRYTRQTTGAAGASASWLPLFPLAARPAGLVFTTGRNDTGYSEAYAVSAESEVYRFWQAPQSEQWFSQQLEIPQPAQTLASVPTHAAEITIVDDDGLPLGGADVLINTAFLTTLWVDGRAYRCSLLDPVKLTTPPTGKLVIHQRATSLAAATLLVSTPRTPAGSPIVVEPNGQLQEKLATLGTKQVLDAKDAQGRPLLPHDLKDRDAVATSLMLITHQAMKIAQAQAPAAAVQYKFATVPRPGLQTRLDLSALGEVAWEIDFSAGYPRYRDMTVAAARGYRAEQLTAAGGIFDIDWGSVWNAIKAGVDWVVKGIAKIVVTIIDGVATILFEIAGKVFEAVLEVVQQAFDFVEGVWNWLKVTFERLYEWLGYLFDVKDFARTAAGVKHTMSVTLDVADYAVEVVRAQVENGFDVLKGNLSKIVDEIVAQLDRDGEPTIGRSFREHPPSDGQVYAGDHNIFLNALSENQGAIRSLGGDPAGVLAASPALDDRLQELIDKLSHLADNFEFGDGKAAFDEALGYFDMVGNQPNRAVELILSGLVRALQGVALYALDFAKGVVLTLIDLIAAILRLLRDALFEAWEIPVVSQLYALFTGKSLAISPVDVVSWCAAIPATILSKLVLGRSPFPDDAALDEFRRTFTVEMIKARIGGGPRAEVSEWDPRWRQNFLCGYASLMLIRPFVDAGLAISTALGKEDPAAEKAEIVAIAMEAMTLGFTAPWALSGEAGGPSCETGEVGFEVTMWICHVALGPLRAAVIHKAPPSKGRTYTAEITLSLWGVAGLIMAIWNFVDGPQHTADKLGFSRELTANIPGQALRFLCLPDINKPAYYIPVGVLAALILLGYWGSLGVAIAELKQAGD